MTDTGSTTVLTESSTCFTFKLCVPSHVLPHLVQNRLLRLSLDPILHYHIRVPYLYLCPSLPNYHWDLIRSPQGCTYNPSPSTCRSPDLLHAVVHSKDFMLALAQAAQAYDVGLGTSTISYGHLYLSVRDAPQRNPDNLFLQTKGNHLDAFHNLPTALLTGLTPTDPSRSTIYSL